jgi:hypothetical protein
MIQRYDRVNMANGVVKRYNIQLDTGKQNPSLPKGSKKAGIVLMLSHPHTR